MPAITQTLEALATKGINATQVKELGGQVVGEGKPWAYAVFNNDASGINRVKDITGIQFRPVTSSCSMKKQGPQLWKAWHIGAWIVPPEKFVTIVDEQIETIRCKDCKAHAKQYRLNHPIPGTTPEANHDWVQDFHDYLNRRLDRAEWGRERGAVYYRSLAAQQPPSQSSDQS